MILMKRIDLRIVVVIKLTSYIMACSHYYVYDPIRKKVSVLCLPIAISVFLYVYFFSMWTLDQILFLYFVLPDLSWGPIIDSDLFCWEFGGGEWQLAPSMHVHKRCSMGLLGWSCISMVFPSCLDF